MYHDHSTCMSYDHSTCIYYDRSTHIQGSCFIQFRAEVWGAKLPRKAFGFVGPADPTRTFLSG